MNKHIWGVQMKKLSFKKTTAVAESMEKHAEQNLGSESGWLMDEQMSAVEELDDTGKEKKEQLKKDKIKKEKVKKEKKKKLKKRSGILNALRLIWNRRNRMEKS